MLGCFTYSGCLALQCAVAPISSDGGYFSGVKVTGSHRESIRAVVNGSADIAAIDVISWQLAERFEPGANALKVIAQTKSRPSLPLITSCDKTDTVMETMRAAIAAAVTALDDNTRELTGITGFLKLDDTDYELIEDDLPKFVIVGRPNAGKSSFTNALLSYIVPTKTPSSLLSFFVLICVFPSQTTRSKIVRRK